MIILVTGCAGFIGSHVCEYYLTQGIKVIGVDNMNGFYNPELKNKNLIAIEETSQRTKAEFVFYKIDIRQQELLEDIITEHHVTDVIHLAAVAGVRTSFDNPLHYIETNELGTGVVFEACKNKNIKNILIASSSSVYGAQEWGVKCEEHVTKPNPISVYSSSKLATEFLARVYTSAYNMKVVALRFFTVFGPRQRPDLSISKFTQLFLKNERLPVYGNGEQQRQFLHVSDAVRGVVMALEWTQKQSQGCFEAMNIAGKDIIKLKDVISALERITGKTAQIQELPKMKGDNDSLMASGEHAKNIFGYEPLTSFYAGLENYVEWVKKNVG